LFNDIVDLAGYKSLLNYVTNYQIMQFITQSVSASSIYLPLITHHFTHHFGWLNQPIEFLFGQKSKLNCGLFKGDVFLVCFF